MPPWHADPKHGRFKNDPTLPDEEVAKITAWVDGGAPEGDPKDLPPPRTFVEGWRIGKPDVVIRMPVEFRVPAKGEVRYKYHTVPTEFTEDRWIQAAEARPGAREVVHHIIVWTLGPEEGRRGLDLDIDGRKWADHLCGTAPGEAPDIFAPGTGKLVKAGSKLLFQIHYTPNGTEAVDRSSVGLIFAKEPVKERLIVRPIGNRYFRIPPGADNHEVKAARAFDEDVRLYSLMPHMHLRGKSFRYEVVYPDDRRETLLSVPKYDFGWQHTYLLAQPLDLPRGTKIECTAAFDNSAANPANPDPTQAVKWGDQTWEEMMIGFVTYTRPERIAARESQGAAAGGD
jgi:hypothetical protein